MGAVKEAAIQLESNMMDVAEIASPTRAYRLGMLEACRLITETTKYYLDAEPGTPAWKALHDTWHSVYDAVTYLQEVDARS